MDRATGGTLPSISSIAGNDPSDAGRIVDGLTVSGSLLADVSFSLRSAADGSDVLLSVRSQSDTAAEVVLPVDVRSGDYTLVASNAAGDHNHDSDYYPRAEAHLTFVNDTSRKSAMAHLQTVAAAP